ncbi:DM13 domain-containing protein [Streptomyces sp. NPDC047097]|uniref:DM13 domain-containing protein n=1 Tax=Streptomyces sp. NPDC047097 TaxID=3155260 RepID=UPI0033F8E9E5
MRKVLSRPWAITTLVAALAAAGLGMYWFQPWKLWQDETLHEALPEATAPTTPGGTSTPTPPRILATGDLISHEHTTSGTAKLVRLGDGSHVVRLEGLDTSSGPDLRVWLTDAPVREGRAGWFVFDDGKHLSLGKLKGNKGDQNYPLPTGTDPADYTSVTIWCDRFDVSFGAAELTQA